MEIRKRKPYEKKLEKRLMSAQSREFLMGSLRKEWEEIERSKRRKELLDMTKEGVKVICKTILVLAALGGAVAVAAVAPNIISAIGQRKRHHRYFNSTEFRKSTDYLKLRGYIEKTDVRKKRGTEEIKLTDLGAKQVIKKALEELTLPKHKKWDKKWRIVMFDIPNRHKHARDGLRTRLKLIGFYQLQESVFVFPHQCKEEVDFCTYIYNVPEYVRFAETELLSEDNDLKEHFFGE